MINKQKLTKLVLASALAVGSFGLLPVQSAAASSVTQSLRTTDPISLLPKMSAENAPTGIATSSRSNSNPFRAFDKNNSSSWSVPSSPQWLEYDFQTPTVVQEYTILPYGTTMARAPKTWEFQGFDGTAWVTLDSQTVTGWTAGTRKSFPIPNDQAYTRYRLSVSANNGDTSNTELAEIEMFGCFAAPAEPRDLWNTANGDGTASIAWRPLNGATGYNVYVDGQQVNSSPVTTTTYTVTGLNNLQTYHLSVSAVNALGESSHDTSITAIPFQDGLIGRMTSDSTPTGIATGKSAYRGLYYLFDRYDGTYWQAPVKENPIWVAYDFQTPAVVKEYTLLPYGANTKTAPRQWTFDAWDGTAWVTLDSRNVIDWTANTRKYFTINNDTAYNKYRLNMTANNGDYYYYELAEFQMAGTYATPAAPFGLWNSANGNGTSTVAWRPLNGATGYNIYIDGQKVNDIPVTGTSYTATGLTNNQIYNVAITAVNASGESVKTNDVQVMPYAGNLIPDMYGFNLPLGVISSTSGSYTVAYSAFDRDSTTRWQTSSTMGSSWLEYDFQTPAVARQYTIMPYGTNLATAPKNWQFQGFDGTNWVTLDTRANIKDWTANTRKHFFFDNEQAFNKYRIYVTATNGSSSYLEIADLEIAGRYAIPAAPWGLSNKWNGDGTVNLSWKPLNGITGYNVYADGVKVNSAPLTGTTYTINNLTNNHLYHVTVTAVNESGESAPSAEVLAVPYQNSLTPVMTTNSAPSGLVTAGDASAQAYRAFDKITSTYWYTPSASQWLEYKLPEPAVVQSYGIQPYATYVTNAPKQWTFEGWNGSAWVPLDTRTVTDWVANTRQNFSFANDQAYAKYRLNITAANGSTSLYIAEVDLIGAPAAPAEQPPVSPLVNSSFETYTGTTGVADGWTSYAPPTATTDLQVVSTPVQQGAQAQRVSASGLNTGQYVSVYQTAPAKPNTQYAVSGLFQVESLNNATVQLYMDYYDANGTHIGGASTTQATVTNGYVLLDNVNITPANTALMRVYALVRATAAGGSGTFYVDNLSIRETTDQLDNASFERYTGTGGAADSWRTSVTSGATADLRVVNSPVQAGSRAQQIAGSALAAGAAINVNQWVAVQPDTSYTITGQFRIDSLTNAKAQLYVDAYDAKGTWLKSYPLDYAQTTGGAFVELNNQALTTPGTAYLRVYAILRGTGANGSGSFVVDNIKVTPTLP